MFSVELDNCKIYAAVDKILGSVGTEATPKSQVSLSVGLTGFPSVEGINWRVGKGNEQYEARPTDDRAWAFVFKYDQQRGEATDIVRDECLELVKYLDENDILELDGFKYTRSRNGIFLNRDVVK